MRLKVSSWTMNRWRARASGVMLDGDPRVDAIYEARNGREAIASIRAHQPHWSCWTSRCRGLDGFAVVEAFGADRMPSTIFVTAHDQYAIRAFEVSAVDYLLKPVTRRAIPQAFQRVASGCASMIHGRDCTLQMRTMLDAIAHPPRRLTRLAIRAGEKTMFLSADAIDRIEACQNYVRCTPGRPAISFTCRCTRSRRPSIPTRSSGSIVRTSSI